MYKNPLRDILTLQSEAITAGGLLWLIYYIGIHYAAIHYFLTSGSNPGFVDETDGSGDACTKSREML